MLVPKPPFMEWAKAPRSIWQAEASLSWAGATDRCSVPPEVPYVIVGSGMTGLSTALELVKSGVAAEDVLMLDAVGPAFGATGRNAGFILSFPGPELLEWEKAFGAEGAVRLCQLNRQNRDAVLAFVEEWNDAHPQEAILLQRGGSISLAQTSAEAAELDLCMDLVSIGASDQYEIGAPTGRLASESYVRALTGFRDAGINPCAYVVALAAASGVSVVTGVSATVSALRPEGDRVRVMLQDGGEVRAERVLLATNGYAKLLLGSHWPVKPVRNQVMVVRCDKFDALKEWKESIYYANYGYDYWRVLPDGRMIVGGGRNHVPGREEGTMELARQSESESYLIDVLLERLTDGDRVTIEQQWSGIMGFSPDGVPFLGTVPATDDRVWFAGGFTGYGLGFHRVVSKAAAECLTGTGTAGIFDAARLTTHAGLSR